MKNVSGGPPTQSPASTTTTSRAVGGRDVVGGGPPMPAALYPGYLPAPSLASPYAHPCDTSVYSMVQRPVAHHQLLPPGGISRAVEVMQVEPAIRRRPSMMSDFHQVQPMSIDVGGRLRRPGDGPKSAGRQSTGALPSYTPQVEAISPTPDDQLGKAEISAKLEKVEREIKNVDTQIKAMERKKSELEESSKQSDGGDSKTAALSTTVVDDDPSASLSLIERIYAENRKKTTASTTRLFEKIGPPDKYIVPLYQEPSDLESYHQFLEKHAAFRPRLIQYITKLKKGREMRERYLNDQYNTLMQSWKKRVERWERNPKKIAKEQRNREIFEKTFPELRKQREEKERVTRMGTRSGLSCTRGSSDVGGGAVSSVAPPPVVDVPPAIALPSALEVNIGSSPSVASEEEERKLRQQAVVPPFVLDSYTRARLRFVNTSGLVRDPLGEHRMRLDTFQYLWTNDEKQVFKEKLLIYGKNFAAISLFLERKNTKDCVQYYYLTKKRENYKQLMRKSIYRRGRGKMYKPPIMPKVTDGKDDGSAAAAADDDDVKAEVEHYCLLCKSKIDPVTNPGRVMTRAVYDLYGIDPEQNGAGHVCQKCRLPIVKKKHSQCPIGVCTTVKRKVKPVRAFPPPKWKELSIDQQQYITTKLKIGKDVTRCCSGCHKRIMRSIESVLLGEELSFEAGSPTWSQAELATLRRAVADDGFHWHLVSTRVGGGRTAHECRVAFEHLQQKNASSLDHLSAASSSNPSSAPSDLAKSPAAGAKVAGIESEEEDNVDFEDGSREPIAGPTLADSSQAAIRDSTQLSVADEKDLSVLTSTMQQSLVKRLSQSVSRELSQSRDSVKSSGGESNATLSADEAQTDTTQEDTSYMSSDAARRVSQLSDRFSSAIQPTALPDLISSNRQPHNGAAPYKPRFRVIPNKPKVEPAPAATVDGDSKQCMSNFLSGLIETEIRKESHDPSSSLAPQTHVEGLGARLMQKAESPEVQVIGHRHVEHPRTPPKPTPTSVTHHSSDYASPAARGCLTSGTPLLRLPPGSIPSTSTTASGPTITYGVGSGAIRSTTAPYTTSALPQPTTLSRAAALLPQSSASLNVSSAAPLNTSSVGRTTTAVSRASPLVLFGGDPSYSQVVAQQQYWREQAGNAAAAAGYTEQQQAALLYNQLMAGAVAQQQQQRQQQQQQAAALQQQQQQAAMIAAIQQREREQQQQRLQQQAAAVAIEQHSRRLLDQQKRIEQEEFRLHKERQVAMCAARVAAHEHKAAMISHQLAQAAEAERHRTEQLAIAAVAEHHCMALAETRKRLLAEAGSFGALGTSAPPSSSGAGTSSVSPSVVSRRGPTPDVAGLCADGRGRSPMTAQAVASQAARGSIVHGTAALHPAYGYHRPTLPATSSTPMFAHQFEQPGIRKGTTSSSEMPLMTKGAMKMYAPTTAEQTSTVSSSAFPHPSATQQRMFTPDSSGNTVFATSLQPGRPQSIPTSISDGRHVMGRFPAPSGADVGVGGDGVKTMQWMNKIIQQAIKPIGSKPPSIQHQLTLPYAVDRPYPGFPTSTVGNLPPSMIDRIEGVIEQSYQDKRIEKPSTSGGGGFAYDIEPISPVSGGTEGESPPASGCSSAQRGLGSMIPSASPQPSPYAGLSAQSVLAGVRPTSTGTAGGQALSLFSLPPEVLPPTVGAAGLSPKPLPPSHGLVLHTPVTSASTTTPTCNYEPLSDDEDEQK